VNLDTFIFELARHPHDEGLRATFADWLLERGDARGEALVLEGRDKRRLEALRKKHAKSWLGSLARYADIERCTFRGGFPLKLALTLGAPVAEEPSTLMFVEEVELHAPSSELLETLPALKRLTGDLDALAALGPAQVPWTLESCEVLIAPRYATFRELSAELDRIAEVPALKSCPMSFSAPLFLEPTHADFLAEAVLRSGVAERDVLGFHLREGAMDAITHWLSWAPSWGGGTQWTARSEGLQARLSRDEDDRFRILQIDLEDAHAKSVALAASVLSQLQSLSLLRVDVTVPEGVRARKQMLDTLQAARRLLPSVSKLRVTQKKR
jgi:uncharacterized protein (TIGR02996 family)